MIIFDVIPEIAKVFHEMQLKKLELESETYREFVYPFRGALLDTKIRIDELEEDPEDCSEEDRFYELLNIILEEVIPVIEERGQYIYDIELRTKILKFEEEIKMFTIDNDDNDAAITHGAEKFYGNYVEIIEELYVQVDNFVKNIKIKR